MENTFLRKLTEDLRKDPVAQRAIARRRLAERGMPSLRSAWSILRLQVEMLETQGLVIDFDPFTGLRRDGTPLREGEPLRRWTVDKEEAQKRIAQLREAEREAIEQGIAVAERMEDGATAQLAAGA